MDNPKKCIFVKSDGKNCNAWPMNNSNFCFTHNPETTKEKKEAVIKGGKANKKHYAKLEKVKIKNQKDVVKLIATTINEVREGLVDVNIAKCIFYGSGQLIRAMEIADLEQRVSDIEEAIKKDLRIDK